MAEEAKEGESRWGRRRRNMCRRKRGRWLGRRKRKGAGGGEEGKEYGGRHK